MTLQNYLGQTVALVAEPVEIQRLRVVRWLLSDPRHWTKNTAWRDALGRESDSQSAVQACLLGANLCAVYNEGRNGLDQSIENALARQLWTIHKARCIVNWNDDPTRTHEEVLAFLDQAIENEVLLWIEQGHDYRANLQDWRLLHG